MLTGRANKLFLTWSNLAAIPAILSSHYWSDSLLVTAAAIGSILHHGAEERYYGPVLWSFSPRQQWWLLQNDRFWAVMAILFVGRVGSLHEWPMLLLTLVLGLASEAVMLYRPPFPPSYRRKNWHCFLHMGWHFLSLGYLAYRAVTLHHSQPTFFELLFLLMK
jgi:hypothetical protein